MTNLCRVGENPEDEYLGQGLNLRGRRGQSGGQSGVRWRGRGSGEFKGRGLRERH